MPIFVKAADMIADLKINATKKAITMHTKNPVEASEPLWVINVGQINAIITRSRPVRE